MPKEIKPEEEFKYKINLKFNGAFVYLEEDIELELFVNGKEVENYLTTFDTFFIINKDKRWFGRLKAVYYLLSTTYSNFKTLCQKQ